MNKKLFAASLSILLLTGCSDASAKLKDGNTSIVKVGNTNITRNQVYKILKNTRGYSIVMNDVTKRISDAAVEVTPEMQAEAQESLDNLIEVYGDYFTSFLETEGITQEEYLNDNILMSLKSEKLTSQYVEENIDALLEKYQPILATVLTFSDEASANAAIGSLKDGAKTSQEIASQYTLVENGEPQIFTTEDFSYPTLVTSVIRSASPDDGWTILPNPDNGTYYVLRVEDNDVNNYRDTAIESLSTVSTVSTDSLKYYLKKYNFRLYDIDIYNQFKKNVPEYLVQDDKGE